LFVIQAAQLARSTDRFAWRSHCSDYRSSNLPWVT